MTDILIILVLIFFNGFFSLAEVALISARKNRIEAMAKEGSRSAASALKLMNDPDCFLSTAQVGITIVAILTGLFSGETFAEKFGEQLLSLGIDENYAQPVAQIIILVVVTYMSCELGELFPKKLGIDRAESMAKLTAPLMTFFSKIMMPVVWLLSKNTELIARGFNLNPENHNLTGSRSGARHYGTRACPWRSNGGAGDDPQKRHCFSGSLNEIERGAENHYRGHICGIPCDRR